MKNGFNPRIVAAYLVACNLPVPAFEYQFAPPRRWRFDLAWLLPRVAVEVQGGIFIRGGHNRGAQMLREWEKLNTAAGLGWRILYCQPQDLCTRALVDQLKPALTFQSLC